MSTQFFLSARVCDQYQRRSSAENFVVSSAFCDDAGDLRDWRTITAGDLLRCKSKDAVVAVIGGSGPDHSAELAATKPVGNCIFADRDPIPSDLVQTLGPRMAMLSRLPDESWQVRLQFEIVERVSEQTTLLSLVVEQADQFTIQERSPGETVDAMKLPPAGPGRAQLSLRQMRAVIASCLGETGDSFQRKCAEAGLLLLWNFTDESHSVSQSMEGQGSPRTADYWHGIMHRREPDAGNAAYWFRRVGRHPAFDRLKQKLPDWMAWHKAKKDEIRMMNQVIGNGEWDANAMIRLSQMALSDPGGTADLTLRRIQYFEMINLLCAVK
ncbi:MAG: hypothetical protein R3C20_19375 [Planctomycetaceae bacterium]